MLHCPATPHKHNLWGSGPLALKGNHCVEIAGVVYLRSVGRMPWPLCVHACVCVCVRVLHANRFFCSNIPALYSPHQFVGDILLDVVLQHIHSRALSKFLSEIGHSVAKCGAAATFQRAGRLGTRRSRHLVISTAMNPLGQEQRESQFLEGLDEAPATPQTQICRTLGATCILCVKDSAAGC